MALFIPTYFSPISQYFEIIKSNSITFEMYDNYQKQSYRNRCYISNANGKLLLNIPVKYSRRKTQKRNKTKDILVENDFPWQNNHLKSLQNAYRSSPFYEFYEDELISIFSKKYTFLQDINIDTFLFVSEAIQISNSYSTTKKYITDTTGESDFRFLADIKKQSEKPLKKYFQVFENKYGFISNLSILDLLFAEGPNTTNFMLNQS